jgi:hypothetical protein
MIPKTSAQFEYPKMTTKNYSRIMLYNTGRTLDIPQKRIQKPKGTQNNLEPKYQSRFTEGGRQMPRGTAQDSGRNMS